MSEATRRVNYLIGGMPIRIANLEPRTAARQWARTHVRQSPPPKLPAPGCTWAKSRAARWSRSRRTSRLRGVNDATGMYETEDVTMVQQYKLKFTTQYIAPEVIQLAFGVADELADNQEAVPFVSNGEIKVWLYGRLTDHAENGKELMEWCVMGRLRLTNTPNFASDPATAEWELSIEYSPLQKLTPKALASPATA